MSSKSIVGPLYLVLGVLAICAAVGLITETAYLGVAAGLSILACGILDHQNRRLHQRLQWR